MSSEQYAFSRDANDSCECERDGFFREGEGEKETQEAAVSQKCGMHVIYNCGVFFFHLVLPIQLFNWNEFWKKKLIFLRTNCVFFVCDPMHICTETGVCRCLTWRNASQQITYSQLCKINNAIHQSQLSTTVVIKFLEAYIYSILWNVILYYITMFIQKDFDALTLL